MLLVVAYDPKRGLLHRTFNTQEEFESKKAEGGYDTAIEVKVFEVNGEVKVPPCGK